MKYFIICIILLFFSSCEGGSKIDENSTLYTTEEVGTGVVLESNDEAINPFVDQEEKDENVSLKTGTGSMGLAEIEPETIENDNTGTLINKEKEYYNFETINNLVYSLKKEKISIEEGAQLETIITDFTERRQKDKIVFEGDASRCDELRLQYLQEECFLNIYLEEGRKKGDVGECDNVVNEDFKIECKNTLYLEKSYQEDNTKGCDMLKGANSIESISQCKDIIYYQRAGRDLDTSLCTKISGSFLKEECNTIVKEGVENQKKMIQ